MAFLVAFGFLAGFVDSIAGGGGLISLPAVLIYGLPPQVALGTNKVIGISTALASSTRYRFSKLFSWRTLLPLSLAAFALSLFGASLATLISPEKLRPIILGLLIFAGLFMLVKRRFEIAPHRKKYLWLYTLVPLIGFYDGFFGPGTGTFLMLSFQFFAHDRMLEASAKSRVINLFTNLAALIWFSSHGAVRLTLVAPAALASFVGGWVGSTLAIRKGAALIRPLFIAVTWLLILKVGWDVWSGSASISK